LTSDGCEVDSAGTVLRPATLLLLLLQLVSAALPGDGVVLCLGGEHGLFGLCEEHGHGPGSEAPAPHDGHTDGAPEVPESDGCRDCDGVHLTRGELESWQPTVAPLPLLGPDQGCVARLAAAWRPDDLLGHCAGEGAASVPRRGPPLPGRTLEVVRLTVLRI